MHLLYLTRTYKNYVSKDFCDRCILDTSSDIALTYYEEFSGWTLSQIVDQKPLEYCSLLCVLAISCSISNCFIDPRKT